MKAHADAQAMSRQALADRIAARKLKRLKQTQKKTLTLDNSKLEGATQTRTPSVKPKHANEDDRLSDLCDKLEIETTLLDIQAKDRQKYLADKRKVRKYS